MKLRKILPVMIGAMMLSESASALSCARPDLIQTLERAKASPKLYEVLVGTFESPKLQRAQPKDQNHFSSSRPADVTKSRFRGYGLSQTWQTDRALFDLPVDIETNCVASFCSDLPASDKLIIAFVEIREGQAPLLKKAPCSNMIFEARSETVNKLRQCFDKTCETEASLPR